MKKKNYRGIWLRFDRLLSRSLLQQLVVLAFALVIVLGLSYLFLSFSGSDWKGFCQKHNLSQWLLPLYLLIDSNALNNLYIDNGVHGWMLFASSITFLCGAFIFNGIIIGIITNSIERRVDDHKRGHIHYLKSGHYIIMGYDERYIENITHSSIVFTKDSINDLSAVGSPENIVYRDDELMSSLRSIIPYLAVLSIVSIVTTVAFTILLTKSVSSNFRRLMMLGFNRKQLNTAFYRLVRVAGIIAIIASFAFSCIVFLFVNFTAVKLLILLLIPFIEIITLLIASNILNKRLWRK